MRKFAAIIAVSAIIAGTASAVDMNGKIGFGVGSAGGNSILIPSNINMDIGITKSIIIEPTLIFGTYISDLKLDSLSPTSDSVKRTTTDIQLGCRALFTLLNKEKSNFYVTGGFLIGMPKYVYEDYSANPDKDTQSEMDYAIFLGLALEHFVTSNFSVRIISEGGYSGSTYTEENKDSKKQYDKGISDIVIGNTNFGIFFNWYL
jgi:hypothetical protein